MERYFIRNCLGQVVGNPKGYATYKGASMIFNRQKMQVELIDLANAEKVKGSVDGAVLIGSIKLEKVAESLVTILRVEDKQERGMYSSIWFECNLPCDDNHPTVGSDSLYQKNLGKDYPGLTWEPSGHRFGFLDTTMLRRWIYNDSWIDSMNSKGAVLCTYQVPKSALIVGRTQVTFNHEKAVCLSRKPLASLLE